MVGERCDLGPAGESGSNPAGPGDGPTLGPPADRAGYRLDETDRRLRPAEELQLITTIITSFQSATAQADSKISMLLVIHPGASLVAAAQAGVVADTIRAGGTAALPVIALTVVFVVCFLVSGYHLVAALRPRTPVPGQVNVFAFPDTRRAGHRLDNFTVDELSAQAWSLAETLAAIAVVKNRHVTRAIRWLAILLVDIALLWSAPFAGPG